MQEPVKIYLTFNNQEWISGPDFKYHDHKVTRVALAHTFMSETADAEAREQDWLSEIPEQVIPDDITDEERLKKEEEYK
jgi:hypothetical protein